MARIAIVIKLKGNWYWQGIIPSKDIILSLKDVTRIAPYHYPNAEYIYITPIFLN